MDCGAFLRAAGPRPTTRCGCATTAGHSSCRPTRRWGGKALRGSTRPLAGRGWLPPPADKQEGWDTGGDFTSSSDEEDDEDLDLFPEEASGDPEFIVENVLATALLTLAALAAAFVVLKLLIVLYSLISAAFRYTVVGVFLVVALVAFQPGRWWF